MDELQIVYTTEAMQDILGISDYYFDKVGESAALRAVGFPWTRHAAILRRAPS